MGNKNVERKCLDIILKDKPQCQFGKDILQSLNAKINECEKPDFIIDKVGIEHFLVDLLFTTKRKKSMSIERKNASAITEKVDYYRDNPYDLDDDIKNGNAVKFVENLVNSQINAVSNFSCQKFINGFIRIFENHYKNRNDYRKKCDKLGFIIEIPYMRVPGSNYILTNNGCQYRQSIRTMPIPKQIINHIRQHNDLDFVILYIRPINNHDKTKNKDILIIYIDPKSKNLFDQKIILCDNFDYTQKFYNKDVAKLNVSLKVK